MWPVWSNFAKTSPPPRRKAKSLSTDGLVLSTPMRLEYLNKSNYAEVANLRSIFDSISSFVSTQDLLCRDQ
eukprot:1104783-Rhodomonas_salina.1